MSLMFAEISRIVNEDVSSRVSQYDVMYEAIINSIHANATKITCELDSANKPLEENGVVIAPPKLDFIKISDDGDGITEENYNSFCKYRSNYKKELGGKGVGRFIFLKVYQNVRFESLISKIQKKCSFKFHIGFDTKDGQYLDYDVADNLTTISFSGLTQNYLDENKSLDRRTDLNLEEIKEKVLLNLIPTLFFYKKKGKKIEINFIDKVSDSTSSITDDDVPNFEEITFPIINREGTKTDFTLHYIFKNEPGKLDAFYCANNRTVCDFAEKDLKISLPNGYSGFVLAESSYFDSHVNNERNDYDIFPVRIDIYSTYSWEMINERIKEEIGKILKQHVPETNTINKAKILEIQEERPYLVNYIDESDIDMAGFIDKKAIIDKAKKKFDRAKEHFLTNSGKESYTDIELQEALQITQNELVSYIYDRVLVIERLKKLIDKKEKAEAIIHDLFMEKYTQDDYFSVGKNNLWLLDDRFTTYSYAASDKRITDVLKEVGLSTDNVKNGNDKPDLSLFFSHNPTHSNGLKSVLIEIKPFDYTSKADRKKYNGIQQLLDYVKAFKEKENIEQIWGFLITDIDKELEERLKGDDYVPLYSSELPIYHRHYRTLEISLYIVGVRTLIFDAEARNKVFLDMIRRQSRLNNLLKPDQIEELN